MKFKNRKWVKWVAAAFVAVMLVLTFFSNTILNATLPEVSAKRVVMGTVSPQITGDGITEVAGLTNILADGMGEVTAVHVTTGQTVWAGVEVMEIQPKDDGTLAELKDQLADAELNYTRALLTASISEGSSNELKRLNTSLAAAQEQVSKAKAYQSEKKKLDSEIAKAKTDLAEAEAAYKKAMAGVTADLENAQYVLSDAQATLANAETNVAYYEKLYAESEPENPELVAARKVLAEAEDAVHNGENLLYGAQTAYTQKEREELPSFEAAREAKEAVDEKKSALEEKYAGVPDLAAAQAEVLSLQDQITSYKVSLEAADVEDEITALDLEQQKKQIEELETKLSELEARLEPKTIVAEGDGVIAELPFLPGQSYEYGATLCAIHASADSYVMRVTIPVKMAEFAKPGTEAFVTNAQGGDYKAHLREVAPAEEDPTGSRDLIFDISG
ncbi:MAG: hypothetical protein IKZ21_03925, partial [Clostridia bacterium]|nr:hypothetical protein [Clostridia bacterium]